MGWRVLRDSCLAVSFTTYNDEERPYLQGLVGELLVGQVVTSFMYLHPGDLRLSLSNGTRFDVFVGGSGTDWTLLFGPDWGYPDTVGELVWGLRDQQSMIRDDSRLIVVTERRDSLEAVVGRQVSSIEFGIGWFVYFYFDDAPDGEGDFLWITTSPWRVRSDLCIAVSCATFDLEGWAGALERSVVGGSVASATVNAQGDLEVTLDNGFRVEAFATDDFSNWSFFLESDVVSADKNGHIKRQPRSSSGRAADDR